MCKHGDTVPMRLPISARKSHTGKKFFLTHTLLKYEKLPEDFLQRKVRCKA
jgi:hypothetical protein